MSTGWTMQGIDFILSKSPGFWFLFLCVCFVLGVFFVFFCFAQTLHMCMYKITSMCMSVRLSLHVFGMSVFNQVWPFITTVFLKYQNTISLHVGAPSVYMHNSARRTCLNVITKTGQNIWKSICRVQPECCRSESSQCGVSVNSVTQAYRVDWAQIDVFFVFSLQSWEK